MPTYYELLQVDRNASDIVIRASYKALLQKYHPDKFGDRARGERISQLLNKAYAVLGDPLQRAEYDASLDDEKASESSRSDPPKKPPEPPPPPRDQESSRPPSAEAPKRRTLLRRLLWAFALGISIKLGGLVLGGFVCVAAVVWERLANEHAWKRAFAAIGIILVGVVTVLVLAYNIRSATNPYAVQQDQQQNGNVNDPPARPIASQPMQQQANVPDWARDQPTPAPSFQQPAPDSAAIPAPPEGYVVDKPTPPPSSGYDTAHRITLNFRDISIRSLLKLISDVSDTPIYVDQSVSGNVRVSYTNLPWDFILEDVIKSNGYIMSASNGAIYVKRAQVAKFSVSRAVPPVKPKPKCEIKDVMTDDEIALCRADANR